MRLPHHGSGFGLLVLVSVLSAACADSHRGHQAHEAQLPEAGTTHDADPATDSASPDAGADEREFLDSYVAASDGLTERCCMQVGLGFTSTPDWVVEKIRERLIPPPSSGARFDADAARACIAGLQQVECSLLKTRPSGPAACTDVYSRGHVALGELCTTPWECAEHPDGDAQCAGTTVGENGISRHCVLVEIVGEGARCVSAADDGHTTFDCAPTLLCDFEGSGTCVRRGELGEPCLVGSLWGDTCAVGSVCDRSGSQRCVAPRAVGEACEHGEQCEAYACHDGVCLEPLFETSGGACGS
jgi:hypothetical protein